MALYHVLVETSGSEWWRVEADSEAEAMENYESEGFFLDYGYTEAKPISAELM